MPRPGPMPAVIGRLLTGLVLAVALLIGGVAAWRAFTPQDSGFPVLTLGGDFTLTDDQGQPYTLAAQRGNVVLLSFGFTHCPDVCPLTLARYRAVLKLLGDEAARVRPVMVSIDPARDTPAVLAPYVRYFDPRITGLTGEPDAVAAVARQYGATAMPAGNGQLAHSDYLYLIDAQGRLRKLHDQQASPEQLAADLRRLLREPLP